MANVLLLLRRERRTVRGENRVSEKCWRGVYLRGKDEGCERWSRFPVIFVCNILYYCAFCISTLVSKYRGS